MTSRGGPLDAIFVRLRLQHARLAAAVDESVAPPTTPPTTPPAGRDRLQAVQARLEAVIPVVDDYARLLAVAWEVNAAALAASAATPISSTPVEATPVAATPPSSPELVRAERTPAGRTPVAPTRPSAERHAGRPARRPAEQRAEGHAQRTPPTTAREPQRDALGGARPSAAVPPVASPRPAVVLRKAPPRKALPPRPRSSGAGGLATPIPPPRPVAASRLTVVDDASARASEVPRGGAHTGGAHTGGAHADEAVAS